MDDDGQPHKIAVSKPVLTDRAPRTRVVLLEVWRPLAMLFVWDIAVAATYLTLGKTVLPILIAPLGSTFVGTMFLVVLQIGEDLVAPFPNTPHDVPLTAMCRTIEPVRGILW